MSQPHTQCPFCFRSRRVKEDGKLYRHTWGRPGRQKECPGSGKTKEEAKAAKASGVRKVEPEPQTRPEDIF